MRFAAVVLLFAAGLAGPVLAAPAKALAPELQPLGFLVGRWTAGESKTAQGTASGRSAFSVEAGGKALLRRDHTALKGPDGKRAGAMDQVMLIYPEGGTFRADYSDGEHVIHYAKAKVEPGRSVTFDAPGQGGAPSFRLSYALDGADALKVSFEMAPPGEAAFKPVAQGEMKRAPAKARRAKKKAEA